MTRIDIMVTLGLYDLLRFVSKVTRRQADRINRTVDIDSLRGYHAYPGENITRGNITFCFDDRVVCEMLPGVRDGKSETVMEKPEALPRSQQTLIDKLRLYRKVKPYRDLCLDLNTIAAVILRASEGETGPEITRDYVY